MARSTLTDLLRRIHAAYAEASLRDMPADEIFDEQTQRVALRRSRFIAGAAALSGTAMLGRTLAPVRALARSSAPRVVIVGGGLAGTTCAYRLHQAGVSSTIYEANASVGGRTWTLRGFWDDGQHTEHGGENISSEHAEIRALVKELGLELVDVRAAQTPGTEEVYWLRGKRIPFKAMLAEYALAYPKIKAANDAAGYPTLWNHHNEAGRRLDGMSAREWIKQTIPGGLDSAIGWMLDLDATTENGGEADVQNSLELIYMLGHMPAYNPGGGFYWVGTDEKYVVKGGNDQIAHRLAAKLPDSSVQTSTALVALKKRSDGSYLCTFESHLQTFDVPADYVILALPFTTLRRVDLTKAGFDERKMMAIEHLPLGTNTKIYVQFRDRPWLAMGYDGATYADTGYQQTLDASRGQSGKSGLLEFYTGGHKGASFGPASFGPPSDDVVRDQMRGLEPLYPGISKAWNGKAFMDYWTGDRWHKGSYSYWAVGQCTSFAGYEGVRQANTMFCGEHTAVDFQGFMNGAVATGQRAAADILHQEGRAAAGVGQ
ncbi:MAG TPA: FAD-dependent oxidoreductase [Candidatus Eremiobacteraceae bacterium]|nr:FAD-dependent oxidoreductase [Candidatus Eremiobacteraceae bacterium]